MTITLQSATVSRATFLRATLLIAGTCIGGGMLAMPVQTATAGFALSILGLIVSWLFMTFTGLLLVESSSWFKEEVHFSSLSRKLAGHSVKILALVVYLFMNYASLIAYTAGGAQLIDSWVQALFHVQIGYYASCSLFVTLFGLVVYLGIHFVGKINLILMMALGLMYVGLVATGVGAIDFNRFHPTFAWTEGLSIYPIILATFSYQMVVPSVCSYLNYDVKKLKQAVVLGTTIPLVIYTLWLLVIYGVVPLEGQDGLLEALKEGHAVTTPLRAHLSSHGMLFLLADGFAFFAVVTSFLGLSVALFEFLNDCLKELRVSLSRNAIVLLTFIPTLLLAMLFPKALLQCLDISGGYGDTILSGLIPIILVWAGRYHKKIAGDRKGGKPVLLFAALFYLIILFSQLR